MERPTINVGLNLQGLYDSAVTASEAFGAMADKLGKSADVCTHPSRERTEEKGRVLCMGCGRDLGRP